MENREHSIGGSGMEDDVLVAIIDESDGASREEMKKSLLERGREVGDGELDKLLQNLENEGKIKKETEENGTVLYYLRVPGEKKKPN